ncbi:hypothetical protein V8E51_011275 [Hyaloscypha variabilis]
MLLLLCWNTTFLSSGLETNTLPKHSGPYLLSLVDRFKLWYRPIFGGRRLSLSNTHHNIFLRAWIWWSIFLVNTPLLQQRQTTFATPKELGLLRVVTGMLTSYLA